VRWGSAEAKQDATRERLGSMAACRAGRDRSRSGSESRLGRVFLVEGPREIKGMFQVLGWSERVTLEGKRLVVGTEVNRTEFSLAS